MAYLVPSGHLKLAIEVASTVGQGEEACLSQCKWRQHKIVHCIALLVCNPNEQVVEDLAIEFEVPNFTARISQPAGDDVDIGCRGEDLAERIEPDDRAPLFAQTTRNMKADEARRAGHQDGVGRRHERALSLAPIAARMLVAHDL